MRDAWNKGKTMSDDFKKKVSKSLIGNKRRWKGDAAGYVAKHMWISKYYGIANMCDFGFFHKAKRFEWANISGQYKRDRSDYLQLCPSCHRRWDKGGFCKRGHEFTVENTYLRKEGWRICRICQRERSRIYYATTH